MMILQHGFVYELEENKLEVLFSRTDGGFTNELVLNSMDLIWV